MDLHRLAEERSIEYHRAIAERLRRNPAVIARARSRARSWEQTGSVSPWHARQWMEVLALPLDEVCALLVDPGERARELRQVTPFAGALDPRERWRIWREVRDRFRRTGGAGA
jgi:hypothetical protein